MPLNKVKSSRRAEEIKDTLEQATGLQGNELAMLAMCLSARVHGNRELMDESGDGYEINAYSLNNRGNDPLLEALFSLLYHRNMKQEAETENLHRYARMHLNHGFYLLHDIWSEAGEDKYAFFSEIEQRFVTVPSSISSAGSAPLRLSVEIGHDEDHKSVVWEYNDSQQYSNQHVAIMGVPGAGKTQFLMSLLIRLRNASRGTLPAIVFDYKGDLSSDARFVEELGASVYDPSRAPLPFNPFVLPDYSETAVSRFAASITDTVAAATNIGTVQQGRLRKGIEEAYQRRRNTSLPHPDFREVSALLQEQATKHDSLTELLERLSAFDLFADNETSEDISAPLHSRNCIINLSRLEAYKELVAYFVLDRLYREMKQLGDSRSDGPFREMRLLIAIDEANNYLRQDNEVLSRLVREGRSFGFGALLSTQSVSDYENQKTDYSEFINNVFMFRIGQATPSQLQRLIRAPKQQAERILNQAYTLPNGECLWSSSSAHMHLRAAQFWNEPSHAAR